MSELDEYDKHILGLLAANSRRSYRDIASHVKLSKDAVRNRIQNYEEQGIIAGYPTALHQRSFCDAVIATTVKTDTPKQLLPKLANHDKINWSCLCIGNWDIIFTYFTNDETQAKQAISHLLDDTVSTFRTHTYTQEHKFEKLQLLDQQPPEQPSKQQPEPPTQLDRTILKRLATNARTPYVDIADTVDISAAAISQRVNHMQNTGLINHFTTALRLHNTVFETYMIGVKQSALPQQAITKITNIPEVTFLTEAMGHYDYFIRITVTGQQHFQTTLNTVKQHAQHPRLHLHRIIQEPAEVYVPPHALQTNT